MYVCDRRMQGRYNYGDAYYRCRFPQEYALANQVPHPRNVYLREDALTDPLDTWPASAFAPHRIAQTITAMAGAHPLNHPPTTGTAAQAIINECDAKLERYRAALDAYADPAVVTGWIAQTQAERARAEADLCTIASTTRRRMSRAEITALVTALGDITTVLRDADPADKAEVYGNEDSDRTTSQKRKRCALKWISTRTVGHLCPRGDSATCSKHTCWKQVCMRRPYGCVVASVKQQDRTVGRGCPLARAISPRPGACTSPACRTHLHWPQPSLARRWRLDGHEAGLSKAAPALTAAQSVSTRRFRACWNQVARSWCSARSAARSNSTSGSTTRRSSSRVIRSCIAAIKSRSRSRTASTNSSVVRTSRPLTGSANVTSMSSRSVGSASRPSPRRHR